MHSFHSLFLQHRSQVFNFLCWGFSLWPFNLVKIRMKHALSVRDSEHYRKYENLNCERKYERIQKNRCTRKMSSHVKRESINFNKWQEYRKYHTLLLAVSHSRWARFWYAHDIWFVRENQVQYYPHKRSELMRKSALQYFHYVSA